MNFYAQGAQAALEKLGAVPFTGSEAAYFQELLKARGLGETPLPQTRVAPVAPQTMVAQPAMAYSPTAPGGTPGTPGTATVGRPMELPPGEKTLQGTAVGVEKGTMAGKPSARRAQARSMEALRSRLEMVPGGGRQLAIGLPTPMDIMKPEARQLARPLHSAPSLQQFLPAMEEPGVNLARQMGKAEGAKALGLGGRLAKLLRYAK